MYKDKRGLPIKEGDYISINNIDELRLGMMIKDENNNLICVEMGTNGERLYKTDSKIDLNKYIAEDLEIKTYEQVEEMFPEWF